AGEIHQHIACFQARFRGRRAGLDVAEAHSVFRLPEIRNGAEPRTIATAAAAVAGDAAMRVVRRDGDEFRAPGSGIDPLDDYGDEVEQARGVRRVDLVP